MLLVAAGVEEDESSHVHAAQNDRRDGLFVLRRSEEHQVERLQRFRHLSATI